MQCVNEINMRKLYGEWNVFGGLSDNIVFLQLDAFQVGSAPPRIAKIIIVASIFLVKARWKILRASYVTHSDLFILVRSQVVLQILMVQFGGVVIGCHLDGLNLSQWAICLACALGELPWHQVTSCPISEGRPRPHLPPPP